MKINKSKLVEQLNNYIKNTPKTKPIDYSTIPELEPIGNKSIDEIIKQTHWNSKDLGILFFYSGLSSYLADENRKVYYYDREKAEKEFDRPINQKHINIIQGYHFIYNWIIKNYEYSSAIIQNRTGKYNYLMGKLRDIYFTEITYNYFNLPVNKTEEPETLAYRRKGYKTFLEPFSLLKYSGKDKEHNTKIENIQLAIKETIKSYYFLLGWNKLLDILANYYNLPDLDLFKYKSIKFIPEEFDKYNKWVNLIYKKIKETKYINKDGNIDNSIKDLRLSLFEQIFKPLDYSTPLKEERIIKARKLLNFTDFKVFDFQNNELLRLLCYRD